MKCRDPGTSHYFVIRGATSNPYRRVVAPVDPLLSLGSSDVSGTMNVTLNMSWSFTTQTTKEDYKVYYRLLEKYYLQWYLPLTISVGLVGGVACVVFLVLSKLFPKNVLIWMVSICVGDLMILSLDATRMMVKVFLDFDVRDVSDLCCKVHLFLSNYFFYWSSYMQAAMSVQRLVFMLRPLQARALFSDRVIVSEFVVVSVLLVVPVAPYLVIWKVKDHDCGPTDTNFYSVTTVLDMILWGLIPLATMTASTIGISWALFRAKSARLHLSGGPNPLHQSKSSRSQGPASVQAPPDNAWHVTRLLIGMNVLYLLSSYPLLIYQIYLNSNGDRVRNKQIPQQVHKTIYYLLRSLCYLGCSWNWVFYCLGGRKFRDKALQLVRRMVLRRRPGRTTEAHTRLVTVSL